MRRLILYGIIIFQIILIVSLVRGIQLSRRSTLRIAALQATKDNLIKEQDRLKSESEYVQSPFYLEKVARDELHLAKEGETVVIVPDPVSPSPEVGKSTAVQVEKANWQKWWDVLSGTQ